MAHPLKASTKSMEIKRPENFDLEKARVTVRRIVQENKEWVREMAAK
jgi:hypothetical protein